jgi:hypothetical protein
MYCSEAKGSEIWTSKSDPNPGGFNSLILKYTSRYNMLYFFDILISKSGTNVW